MVLKIHGVEHLEKMTPLTTGEMTFRQHVRELVSGVKRFDLDCWLQIDTDKQPIQCVSVGSETRVSSSDFCHVFKMYDWATK